MGNSAQKLSFQVALGNIARKGANDAIDLIGLSLPASVVSVSGAFVTIKFEVLAEYSFPQITVPIATSQYVRVPIKIGDKGILIPCDANIAGISGQNNGTASIEPLANLSSLVFLPIGNKKWANVDPSMLVLTGDSDVMIRDDTHQLQLEDENSSWDSLISQINSLLITIATDINAAASTSSGLPPITFTPITSGTNPVKARV
jgi:hypothetical protein